jgi:hypothetical protein
MRKLLIGLGAVLIVAAAAYASGSIDAFTRSFTESRKSVLEGHQGIPSCDTETGMANARAAIDNSPLFKKNGISALAISGAKTSLSSENRVECEGEVILSNSLKGQSLTASQKTLRSTRPSSCTPKSILISYNIIDHTPRHRPKLKSASVSHWQVRG